MYQANSVAAVYKNIHSLKPCTSKHIRYGRKREMSQPLNAFVDASLKRRQTNKQSHKGVHIHKTVSYILHIRYNHTYRIPVINGHSSYNLYLVCRGDQFEQSKPRYPVILYVFVC